MSDKKHLPENVADDTVPKTITRRTFATGAAATFGSMLLAPIAQSATEVTYLLPGAEEAYAADLDPTIYFPASEACIVIYDPTKTTTIAEEYSGISPWWQLYTSDFWKVMRRANISKELKNKPYNPGIPKATIHITSASSENSFDITLETDEQGCAIVKLSEIAQPVTVSDLITERTICANIEIDGGYDGEDDGYDGGRRLAHFPYVPINSGDCLAIPITKAGSSTIETEYDGAYFREISMDGWNVLTEQQSFVGSANNNVNHTLRFDLISRDEEYYRVILKVTKSDDESRVGKTLCSVGADCRFPETRFTARPSYKPLSQTAEFQMDFFNPSSEYYIYPDEEVSLELHRRFEDANSAALGVYPVGVKTVLPVSQGEPVKKNTIANFTENYGTTTEPIEKGGVNTEGLVRPEGQTISFPNDWPGCLAGFEFKFWTPSAPGIFKYDPISGTLTVGSDIVLVDLNNFSATPGQTWQTTSCGYVANQVEYRMQKMQKAFENLKSWWGSPKKFGFNTLAVGVEIIVRYQHLTTLTYSKEKGGYDGETRAIFGVTFDLLFTLPWRLGNVIGYLQFGFSGEISCSMATACQSMCDTSVAPEDVMKKIQRSGDGYVMPTFHLKATASLALGEATLASIGVRAYGGINVAYQYRAQKPSGKKDPRFIWGYEWGVKIFAQAFGCEVTGKEIWGGKNPTYYDSDNDSSSTASLASIQSSMAQANANESFSYADMNIVDGGTLAKRSEITVDKPSVSVMADSDSSTSAFVINDFTTCGASARADEICMATMTSVDSTDSENDDVALFANESSTTYSWPEGHESEIVDRGTGNDSIKGVVKGGGLEPRHMDFVAKDVFSGAQVKFVEIGDACYLFRIACVTINGLTRSRVVYQKVSNDKVSKPFPVVFEDSTFTTGTRDDFYDFDFDVKLVNKQKNYADIVLMVLSSKRPQGDDTTIYDAAEATVLSAIRLVYVGSKGEDQAPFATKSCKTWQSKTYEESKLYFAFSDMSLHTRSLNHDEEGFNQLSRDGYDHAIGHFIIRASKTKENLLSSNNNDTQFGLGVVHMSIGNDDALEITTIDLNQAVYDVTIDSLMSHPTDENSLYSTIGYATPEGCGEKAIKLTFDTSGKPNKLQSAQAIDIISPDPLVKALSPWNSQNSLLASVSTKEDVESQDSLGFLCLCDTPTADEIARIENGGSPKSFNKSETCISSQKIPMGKVHVDPVHKFCYYASNHSGEGFYNYTENGFEPCTLEPEYAIKAMALADGVFSNPFTFANCGENHVDSFCAIEDTDNTNCAFTRFVICDINENESGCANIYHFTMPFLACIGIEDIKPYAIPAYAGEDALFVVALKNYGNTVLTSAVLSFYDEEGLKDDRPIATQMLTFSSAEKVTNDAELSGIDESDDSPYYEDAMSDETKQSLLVADNGSAVLAPGQTKSYVVTIPIPQDWDGEKTIYAVALSSDTTVIDPGTSQEISPSDSSHIDAYESEHTVSFASTTIEVQANTEVEPDYYVLASSDDKDPNDSNNNSANNGKTSPGTGDSSFIGLAALALGAVGAGLAAYSARRTKLESGDVGDEEEQ